MYCIGSISWGGHRYEGHVLKVTRVCAAHRVWVRLHACAFWCVPSCVCAAVCTPTPALRLRLGQASATSVHHHRYGPRSDSRSGGAQDILSTLSCLLIMISFDGFPTRYRQRSARTYTHTFTHIHTHVCVHMNTQAKGVLKQSRGGRKAEKVVFHQYVLIYKLLLELSF